MSGEWPRRLVVGLLGMPDNAATQQLLQRFDGEPDASIDFVVYWTPSLRDQWRRLRRKMRFAGLSPAIGRIAYALRHSAGATSSPAPRPWKKPLREYFVKDHNGPECQRTLRKEKVDILLLGTDAILRHEILAIPALATLNAHPGWVPRYRGLGGLLFQMERGFKPAVSLHCADEGIDTGPVILRREFAINGTCGLDRIDEQLQEHQRTILVEGVRLFQKGPVAYLDTFLEPSNMTRGMALCRVRRLDRYLRSGRLLLARSLQ